MKVLRLILEIYKKNIISSIFLLIIFTISIIYAELITRTVQIYYVYQRFTCTVKLTKLYILYAFWFLYANYKLEFGRIP